MLMPNKVFKSKPVTSGTTSLVASNKTNINYYKIYKENAHIYSIEMKFLFFFSLELLKYLTSINLSSQTAVY